MHTSVLESVNNRIKVIKRMAYGFGDSGCFFLKIKAAFSGKHAEKKKKNKNLCPPTMRASETASKWLSTRLTGYGAPTTLA